MATPPLLGDSADVHERPCGTLLVVPYVLPIVVPVEALSMTVAEWLGLARADA